MWFSSWLATLLKSYLFMVNDGNEDREDLVRPAAYSLENTQNVFFRSLDTRSPSDRIGGWFIKPFTENGNTETVSKLGDLQEQCANNNADCEGILDVGRLTKDDTVFILLHGNAKNRGASHRIAAYKIFQSLGYYTLTMDYRGYGDSDMSYPLNETTVVEDAMAGIGMIRRSVGSDAKLILYGHSLGTGISAHAAALCMQEPAVRGRVDGIILDSPFHSMGGLLKSGKIAAVLDYILDLEHFLRVGADVWFDTPGWLSGLDIPVRVFHAVVDPVTPLSGAQQLVEDVKKTGKENIDLHVWKEEGLGHIGISKTKTFKQEIKNFAELVHLENKL